MLREVVVPLESLSFLPSSDVFSKDSGGFPRGWYSGSEPPADGPCGDQRKLQVFVSQDIIHNTPIYQLCHLLDGMLRDSKTRLENQGAKTSFAPFLGSTNKGGLGIDRKEPWWVGGLL